MGRLLPLLVLADLALIVVALIDCLSAEDFEIRVLPRVAWVFVILLFSPVGGIVWFMVGRPDHTMVTQSRGAWSPDEALPDGAVPDAPQPGRVLAPDDDPEFLRQLDARNRSREEDRLRAWEADLLRRERELRRDQERHREREVHREREARGERERPTGEPPADPKL